MCWVLFFYFFDSNESEFSSFIDQSQGFTVPFSHRSSICLYVLYICCNCCCSTTLATVLLRLNWQTHFISSGMLIILNYLCTAYACWIYVYTTKNVHFYAVRLYTTDRFTLDIIFWYDLIYMASINWILLFIHKIIFNIRTESEWNWGRIC